MGVPFLGTEGRFGRLSQQELVPKIFGLPVESKTVN